MSKRKRKSDYGEFLHPSKRRKRDGGAQRLYIRVLEEMHYPKNCFFPATPNNIEYFGMMKKCASINDHGHEVRDGLYTRQEVEVISKFRCDSIMCECSNKIIEKEVTDELIEEAKTKSKGYDDPKDENYWNCGYDIPIHKMREVSQ